MAVRIAVEGLTERSTRAFAPASKGLWRAFCVTLAPETAKARGFHV
jgi:hypothetical protein